MKLFEVERCLNVAIWAHLNELHTSSFENNAVLASRFKVHDFRNI